MTLMNFMVELFRKADAYSWSTSALDISDNVLPESLAVIDTVGKTKDRFEFDLFNRDRTLFSGSDYISEDDKVKVYFWTGTGSVDTSSDLIMDGVVTNVDTEFNVDRSIVKVRGQSFVNSLFNAQVFQTATSSASSITHSQNILDDVNRYFQQKTGSHVFWSDSNPTTKQDGTAFPTFTFFRKWNPAIDLIDELWSDKYTSDGSYVYWVEWNDSTNQHEFRVAAKSQTVSSGNTITEGNLETDFNVEMKVDGVINVVIFNCGSDAYGNPIEDFHYDIESMNRYGAKWKYVIDTQDVAQLLLENEKNDNPTLFDRYTNSEGVIEFTNDNFPTAYDYTMSCNGVIVSSDNDFNEEIRKKSKSQGREVIDRILIRSSNARPFVRVSYPRTAPELNTTQLYFVTAQSHNLTDRKLRVTRKTYRLWDIEYELEEDAEALTAT